MRTIPRPPLILSLAFVLSGERLAPGQLGAQPPQPAGNPSAGADSAALEQFTRVHLAIQRLRDREHTELADPRNKTPQTQQEIRGRFARERRTALQSGGMTDSVFADWTRRVSATDALRLRFEQALTRLGGSR